MSSDHRSPGVTNTGRDWNPEPKQSETGRESGVRNPSGRGIGENPRFRGGGTPTPENKHFERFIFGY